MLIRHDHMQAFKKIIPPAVSSVFSIGPLANHIFFITPDGRMYGCGKNTYGQLGLGDKVNRNVFTRIPDPPDRSTWVMCACGTEHTLAISSNGKVWCTGRNNRGQLGTGNTTDRSTFIMVPTFGYQNDEKGSAWRVACGHEFSAILHTSGSLFLSGDNSAGQLGRGFGDSNIISSFNVRSYITSSGSGIIANNVACGYKHFAAINANSIYTCGQNGTGELGQGDNSNRSILTQCPSYPGSGVFSNVGCSYYNTYYNRTTSQYVTGANNQGQCGTGDSTSSYKNFVLVGTKHSFRWPAIGYSHLVAGYSYIDGTVTPNVIKKMIDACGTGTYGQLGNNSTGSVNRSFVIYPSSSSSLATTLFASEITTCGANQNSSYAYASASGMVYAWGDNQYGQLGLGSITQKNTPQLVTINY